MAQTSHADLLSLLQLEERLDSGDLDAALKALDARRRKVFWQGMPERIVLVRHGESEGNVDHTLYTNRGDSKLELTPKGMEQANEAGARLFTLLGESRLFVVVSPFERAQQTLLGIYQGGPTLRENVVMVHHDPRIREQEFGNFQSLGLTALVRAEEERVGRFYYRRPHGESSADVYDRVSAFWYSLLETGPASLLQNCQARPDAVLMVTHGLTIRLLLMAIFNWSVSTFESVFNLGNCHHVTLRKNAEGCCYDLCVEESFPPHLPWATKRVWVRLRSLNPSEPLTHKIERLKAFRASAECKELGVLLDCEAAQHHPDSDSAAEPQVPTRRNSLDEVFSDSTPWTAVERKIEALEAQAERECSRPFTVVDYLAIKPPRAMNTAQAVQQMVVGHPRGSRDELLRQAVETEIDLDDVESIDWWGDQMSAAGKRLRLQNHGPWLAHGTSSLLDGNDSGRRYQGYSM